MHIDLEIPPRSIPVERDDEFRAFMLVVRQALLMIVAYIERRYDLRRR